MISAKLSVRSVRLEFFYDFLRVSMILFVRFLREFHDDVRGLLTLYGDNIWFCPRGFSYFVS